MEWNPSADLMRMLFGDQPPFIYLEIIVRTAIVYLYTLLLLRWLGSRTIGQLSTIEFLLVIALGSAVGDAMFYPEVPLVHALLVVTLVVLANKGLDLLIMKSRRAELAIDGSAREVIKDGVLCAEFLKDSPLSTTEIFQQLRTHGIEHLGEVRHAFLETDGVLSVFKADATRIGLPIMPPWEIKPPPRLSETRPANRTAPLVCRRCGSLNRDTGNLLGSCSNCQSSEWTVGRTS